MPTKKIIAKKVPPDSKPKPRKRPTAIAKTKPDAAAADGLHASLLRKRCLQAGAIGAATALTSSLPGMATASRLILGSVLDASMLARLQLELVEETFALYDFALPESAEKQLATAIVAASTASTTAGDLLARNLLLKIAGGVGGLVLRRVTPLVRVATSAAGNIAVTYAVGRRAQAMAKLGGQPITALPDTFRAFTGLDERRLLSWATEAVQSVLSLGGGGLRWFGQGAKAVAALTKGVRRRNKSKAKK